MITIDLITGFLGAGKTTFIRKYATHLMEQGLNIGILENDHGAVNVDMMLLQELRGDAASGHFRRTLHIGNGCRRLRCRLPQTPFQNKIDRNGNVRL